MGNLAIGLSVVTKAIKSRENAFDEKLGLRREYQNILETLDTEIGVLNEEIIQLREVARLAQIKTPEPLSRIPSGTDTSLGTLMKQ